jgi:hypothetical protein
MSRQLQAALGVILTNPVAFFFLWDFPGYEGFVASTVILLVGLLFLHVVGANTQRRKWPPAVNLGPGNHTIISARIWRSRASIPRSSAPP